MLNLEHRLPLRSDVTSVTYWRNPTKAEINFGYGATHYREFTPEECCFPNTRIPKKWFVSRDDGLRYFL